LTEKNKKRVDLTNYISEIIKNDFEYYKEVSNRYKFNIGLISIESENKINLTKLIRSSDKLIEIKYEDKYFYFIFALFVEENSLYQVVKKIESEYSDIQIYFELLKKDTRIHIKNFIDSLYFNDL